MLARRSARPRPPTPPSAQPLRLERPGGRPRPHRSWPGRLRAVRRPGTARESRSPIAAAVGICSFSACACVRVEPGSPAPGGQPHLEQRHLGLEVFESASVVGHARVGVPGLPRADHAVARGAGDIGRAVGVDASPGGAAGAHDNALDTRALCRWEPVSLRRSIRGDPGVGSDARISLDHGELRRSR